MPLRTVTLAEVVNKEGETIGIAREIRLYSNTPIIYSWKPPGPYVYDSWTSERISIRDEEVFFSVKGKNFTEETHPNGRPKLTLLWDEHVSYKSTLEPRRENK